jgi:inorganic pyrophosphatase
MIHEEFKRLLSTQYKSHPWHGVSAGASAPEIVQSYIEIVPTSAVKLEVAKATGHLHVDRPQRFSSLCPMLYGFVPQTYCGETIAEFCMQKTGLKKVTGDGDPLDICIMTEKDFAHGDILVSARPIGGLRMVDKGQADDKIIAVMENDIAYGGIRDIKDAPPGLIERLQHYFLSYKRPPGSTSRKQVVEIRAVYGRKEAEEVIRRSMADYTSTFGTEEERLVSLRNFLVDSVIEELAARGLIDAVKAKVSERGKSASAARRTSPKPRGR